MGNIKLVVDSALIRKFIRREKEKMTGLSIAGLKALQISTDGFAFDSTTGATYTLNRCGRLVLEKLQNGEDRTQIATALSDRFGIAQSLAERDLTDFLGQMEALGISLKTASKPIPKTISKPTSTATEVMS